MTESAFKGRGFRNLTNQALARLQAESQAQIDFYNSLAEQARQRQTQTTMVENDAISNGQVSEYVDENGNPVPSYLADPNSAFNKRLGALGKTYDDYRKMSVLERQRDVIDPMLQEAWTSELSTNTQLQQSNNLDKVKEAWFNQYRNKYDANFDAIEKKEGLLDKVTNFGADVGEGVVDVVGALGDITKPIFGQENWFAQGTDAVRTGAGEFLKNVQSDAEKQREEYLGKKLAQGEYGEAGKFLAENGMMVVGEAGKVLGGVGGFGKLAKGAGYLAGKGLKLTGAT